jgi:hypothetical protein
MFEFRNVLHTFLLAAWRNIGAVSQRRGFHMTWIIEVEGSWNKFYLKNFEGPNQWTPHRSRALQFVNRGLAELAIRKCGPVIAKVVEFEQPVSKVTES